MHEDVLAAIERDNDLINETLTVLARNLCIIASAALLYVTVRGRNKLTVINDAD